GQAHRKGGGEDRRPCRTRRRAHARTDDPRLLQGRRRRGQAHLEGERRPDQGDGARGRACHASRREGRVIGARPVNLLVTGRPGSGKTTVIERVVASLPNGAATGFFTREVRERGVRRGFTIQTLDGRTAVLADVGAGAPRVGRYRVRLDGRDAVGVPA